eukprot:CAMPEP_0178426298 /NCGR_PEP_ID=MMETSP0689_2-20121128/29164_1 /TAXON_ID=160604 /ORGANISM="Amphidinium massartii, Strain CS-259" /LENGTH=578 /DNA_ID=CAMNT_0020047983 /DNA_START=14 /DNA_END=1747 /DNA_ORIENTATION=-
MQAIANLGDYISHVVLKEVWALELQQLHETQKIPEPDGCWYNGSGIRDHMLSLGPDLAQDILDAAGAWIPIARTVSPVTLLPDLDYFPPSVEDSQGLSPMQRKLFMSALQVILSDIVDFGSGAGQQQPPPPAQQRRASEASTVAEASAAGGFPGSAVANIAAQILAALEHLMMMHSSSSRKEMNLLEPPEACMQAEQGAAFEQEVLGSKQGLLKELQNCRTQIVNLEHEMATQARVHAAQLERVKEHEARTSSRLGAINSALEEKLKQRRDENVQLAERLRKVEKQAEQERQDEVAKSFRIQSDIFATKQDYAHRALKVRLEEFDRTCQDHQRRRRLQQLFEGPTAAGIVEERQGSRQEATLHTIMQETYEKITEEFDVFFAQREEHFQELVTSCEAALEAKRQRCLRQQEDFVQARKDATAGGPRKMRSQEVQVQGSDWYGTWSPASQSATRAASARCSSTRLSLAPGLPVVPNASRGSADACGGSMQAAGSEQRSTSSTKTVVVAKPPRPGPSLLPMYYPKTIPLSWRQGSPLHHSVLRKDREERMLDSERRRSSSGRETPQQQPQLTQQLDESQP